ncbi:UV-stimulated scaffold protein A [Rhinichthys klamathensis goyatoka]|uniref:UV-stimulated scaffold protein A n=1 Tax=Rhinichthys klamathensis goyatoka TaxID=3034132 RepID=UPI0024B4BA85|nr:UV-stimulated scaffold protein A [Rhinichthys klamathensis goyatoka]
MDQTMRDKLSQLVEELTTSGEPQLNQDKMKEVKKMCKVSNDYIDHFYHLIMTQLNQEHAEIRLSAFQMLSEIFSRSHHFRGLLITNFQEFLELTVETDAEQPLPPPKEVARKLRTLAIQTVQSWHATYGEAYKKLSLGYHFLKQIKKVDFHDVEARTLAERKRQEEKQKRLERIYKERLEKAKEEMEEMTTGIEETLTEMNNCIKLLATDDLNLFNEEAEVANSSAGAEDKSDQPCCSKDLSNEQNAKMSEKRSDEGHTDESSDESDTGEVPDVNVFLRSSGLMSYKYQLELNVSTDLQVRETEENEALVNTVRDLHRLVTTRHLPLVQSWIQVFTKVGVEEELMRRATELKKSLELALRKHEDLHIDYKNRERRVMRAPEDGEDSEEDFVDVPEKEGYEPHIPEHLRAEYGLDETPSTSASEVKAKPAKPPVRRPVPLVSASLSRLQRKRSDEEQDPTCAAATLRVLRQRLGPAPSTSVLWCFSEPVVSSGQEAVSGAAPVVPFGVDLYYWGEEQPTAGKIIKNTSQHQFWVPHEVEEEVENKELSAEMKSRYITFAGKFKPVEHKCKAPMPDGSLCERQDRVKCPFHGRVIPRDELGRPVHPEDALRLEKEKWKRQEQQPDWRDPELMRDIEAATGEDLGSSRAYGKGKKGRGKGKRKRKFPNLTDLKQKANTSRSRLEKKVFNKSSMRRVTDVMNKMDKRKHDKFANQFNYALN